MIYKKLKDLKEKSKMSNHEISELSGVPESTINRIFSGHTDNPSFQTICDIVLALDGSLDDFVAEMNLRVATLGASNTHFTDASGIDDRAEEHHEGGACKKCEKHIETIGNQYKSELERKDKCLTRLFQLCIVLCGIITLLSIALVVHGMSI